MGLRLSRDDDRGSSAVEFALIAGFLFIPLMFTMVQYSLYFWSTQSAANAARDAARRGAVGQTCSELQNSLAANVKLVNGSVTVTRRYFAPSTTVFTEANKITASNTANVRIVITYNSVNLHFPFVPFIKNGFVQQTSLAKVENYTAPTGPSDDRFLECTS